MCFRCKDKTKRIKESDLIKRQQDRNHTDYCCPICECVIICEVRE